MVHKMTKIMLVEDDKSLREIYGVRLLAEGYDIVSAGDGEEALAMAIKERPQLIVSDVMMPKISGFDMLDILRSTTETRDIKVIMMTALSSEEQRLRGEKLGADRYLVKSQVGIEDVVKMVHEVLEDLPVAAPEAPAAPATTAAPTAAPLAAAPAPSPAPNPTADYARQASPAVPPRQPAAPQTVAEPAYAPAPAPAPAPAAPAPVSPVAPDPTPAPAPAPIEDVPVVQAAPQVEQPVNTPSPAVQSPPFQPVEPPKPASIKSRVIEPLNDPSTQPVDMNQLLDKELAKEAGLDANDIPMIQTTEQEREALEQELANFEANQSQSDDYNGNVPPPPPPSVPGI